MVQRSPGCYESTTREQGVETPQKLTRPFAVFGDIGQKLRQFSIKPGCTAHPLPSLGIAHDSRKGLAQLLDDRSHLAGIGL